MKNKIRLKNICVAADDSNFIYGLGTTAVDALRELGFNVFAPDKIEDAAKSDAVFLISGMRKQNKYLAYLEKLGSGRPKVIAWQIDPVPPPELTLEAERTCVLIHNLNINTFLGAKRGKQIKNFIPLNRQFTKAARWLLSIKLERKLKEIGGYSMMPSEGSEWGRMMERYLTFKAYIGQGLIDYSFTTSAAREKFFKSRGLDIRFVPLGYHPFYGKLLNLRRDIDVLFIGGKNNRRRKILINNIARKLSKNSINLKIVEDSFGDARTELLNRAKIVLNIPRVQWEPGGARFLLAMSCGALVVSTNLKYPAPYEPGVHFVSCSEQNITDSILSYLSNDSQRQKIADDAYRFVTTEITVTKMMSKIMETCNAYPSF